MNNLQERIKQAQSLNTGLMLDKQDVKHLKVVSDKKNTLLNRMLETDGRRLVVCGYCDCGHAKGAAFCNTCPLETLGSTITARRCYWCGATPEIINEAYEILTEEEQA